MQDMRILHLIDSLDSGGAETLLMSYLPLLDGDKHIVVTLHGPNVFSREGYEYIELNATPVRGFLKAVIALRKIIIEKKITIVHAHSFWTNIISRLATPCRILLVNHYHFADYDTLRQKKAVQRMVWLDRTIRHSRLVRVAVSEYVEKILKSDFPSSDIRLVPNFITCTPIDAVEAKVERDVLKVIAVGNCNLEKNYALIINAFKALQKERIHLDIYGGGSRLEFYRNEVKQLGLDNINFCGPVPRVREKLSAYHLFLSASVSETFGIAVLEAVCAKLPLLISDIPAFREVAPEGTSFFDPYDKEELVKKLKLLLGSTFQHQNEWAYEKVLDKYSAIAFIGKLKSLYITAENQV